LLNRLNSVIKLYINQLNLKVMQRRSFLKSAAIGSAAAMVSFPILKASAAPKLKITKIRYYAAPGYNKPLFNQARGIVEIETDGGIIGIGEGGSKDMIEQVAQMIIGEDPFRIEYLWQDLFRGMFYPPGREKLHAIGALDLALWDIKGKALGVPVYELLGGATRDYVECYATGYFGGATEESRAVAAIEAGLRCYRAEAAGGNQQVPFDFYDGAKKTIELCQRLDKAVGGGGKWAVDLHTRFDPPEAIKICDALQNLEPYFVEDIIRSENAEVYKTIRPLTKVPLTVGEQFGSRWDITELVEHDLINYSRVTMPNCGGISEYRKIASMCETHYVGLIPHFTGPLATAALVHVLGSSSPTRSMIELVNGRVEKPAYFNEDLVDFRKGKLYLNPGPGLGVKFDPKKATFIMEITAKTRNPHPILHAPDGSVHNW
jgi:galactonate dehydratase